MKILSKHTSTKVYKLFFIIIHASLANMNDLGTFCKSRDKRPDTFKGSLEATPNSEVLVSSIYNLHKYYKIY